MLHSQVNPFDLPLIVGLENVFKFPQSPTHFDLRIIKECDFEE